MTKEAEGKRRGQFSLFRERPKVQRDTLFLGWGKGRSWKKESRKGGRGGGTITGIDTRQHQRKPLLWRGGGGRGNPYKKKCWDSPSTVGLRYTGNKCRYRHSGGQLKVCHGRTFFFTKKNETLVMIFLLQALEVDCSSLVS